MKSNYTRLTSREKQEIRKQLRINCEEALDLEKDIIVYRTIGLLCIALRESEHWGAIRLDRLAGQLSHESLEQYKLNKDGVGDEILCERLRRIGMAEIADVIMREHDKLREIYGDE